MCKTYLRIYHVIYYMREVRWNRTKCILMYNLHTRVHTVKHIIIYFIPRQIVSSTKLICSHACAVCEDWRFVTKIVSIVVIKTFLVLFSRLYIQYMTHAYIIIYTIQLLQILYYVHLS